MLKALIASNNLQYTKKIMNEIFNRIDDIRIECLCTNAEETLDIISKKYFDLILLDLQMSRLSGLKILERMKSLNFIKMPKVIIMSEDIPSFEYNNLNGIACNMIFRNENSEDTYKKIIQVVNDINYQKKYNNIKEKTILELQKIGYNLKLKGTKYILDSILHIYRV